MGEVAEMMLDGTCCQYCGEFFHDDETPGHPRSCGCDDRRIKNDPADFIFLKTQSDLDALEDWLEGRVYNHMRHKKTDRAGQPMIGLVNIEDGNLRGGDRVGLIVSRCASIHGEAKKIVKEYMS